MRHLAIGILVLVLTFAVVPMASAHTPLGAGSNEHVSAATRVPDPTKSWAIYADLHQGGEAQYYKFDIAKGQRIHVTLFTTTSAAEATFIPSVVLMGPGVPSRASAPEYVQRPLHATLLAVAGVRAPRATYEPFAPSSFLNLADISLPAPANGTYYVAVYDVARGGHYGLAVGDREASTFSEWVLNPLAFPSIYLWEGEGPVLVFGPALLVLGLGIVLVARHRTGRSRLDLRSRLAAGAGLLFLATAATVASQMTLSLSRSSLDAAAVVTLVLVALQIAAGSSVMLLAVRASGHWTTRSRVYLALAGIGAALVWAGYVVGPVLAVVAAAVPVKVSPTRPPRTPRLEPNLSSAGHEPMRCRGPK